MPLFMLKTYYGAAIVCAKDQKESLAQLKQHEDHVANGTFLSLGICAEDLKPISPETPGVLLYIRND
ncbi:MAG: hypothetical protein WCW31_05495 [Patescibacteria group bacterium]|jgi:hypothetical protein